MKTVKAVITLEAESNMISLAVLSWGVWRGADDSALHREPSPSVQKGRSHQVLHHCRRKLLCSRTLTSGSVTHPSE